MVTNDVVAQDNLNTVPISTQTNTLTFLTLNGSANDERYFPYATSSTTNTYEVSSVPAENGQLTAVTSIGYSTPDNYGNFASVTTTLTDEDSGSPYYETMWTSATVNTITPNTSTWCLDLPSGTTVTNSSTAPGGGAITRTVSYTPDYTNCRETQRIIEPGNSTYEVTEGYTYDGFGNLWTDTVTGVGVTARTATITWGTSGQFPTTITNPLGQTVTLGHDPNSGMLTSQTDLNYTTSNRLMTTWAYDDFARKIKETRPDGTYTTWTYNNCASWGGCLFGTNTLALAHYVTNTDGSVLTDGSTYFDQLDRPIMAGKRLLVSGTYDRNEVRYDSLGRVKVQYMPCVLTNVVTTCPYWITVGHDILNRVTQTQRPISATNSTLQTTTYGYAGRTTTVQDALNNTTTKITLVTGSLARSLDAKGYYQNFSYDAFGSLKSVTDSASNTLFAANYSYGLNAFQTSSVDMDLGARSYTINALGEVTAYTDAKSQSFSTTYDALSRPLVRTEPDLTTTWIWGNSSASYNIGRLQSVTAASTAGTYSEAYTYDSKTRPSTRALALPGDASYTYTSTYNTTTGLPAPCANVS
jgi:YD repeat-containing protein